MIENNLSDINIKPMKCKQCRSIVIENFDGVIVNGHGEIINFAENDHKKNICGNDDTVWYLDSEKCPSWIVDKIFEFDWVKGRLNCPKCDARIGSFDFKKGSKCSCSSYVLPGVSIIKSKVDI